MSHLSDGDVARFLSGRSEPTDRERVVRHLLSGCGLCSRKLVEQAPDSRLDQASESRRRSAASRDPLDRALDAALRQDARWRTEQRKLALSLELLDASPGGYDALSFQQVQNLQGPGLVEALLRKSFELRYRDPRGMRWLAYNALKAAEGLRPGEHGTSRVFDEQARSWAELANAYRLNDEMVEADAAFARARSLLRRGSGDLHLLARTAELEATLRKDQRRAIEADGLFARASRLYLKLGETSAAGRVLVSTAHNLQYSGLLQPSVKVLERSLSLLDPDRDLQVAAAARQALIFVLSSSGQSQKAGRLLLQSGLRQVFADDPLALLKLRWAEGKVLAGFDRLSSAERALSGVRSEYLERGQEYDAALVAIDLIPVWLHQGKAREARETARRAHELLREIGIHREAARAKAFLM